MFLELKRSMSQCNTNSSTFGYMSSIQKVSSHVIWKIEAFIGEDTRHRKHCTQDNDASVPFKAGTLGPHTVLPIAISWLIIFSWTHWQSEISFLSKVILVLGKARSFRVSNLSCSGAESSGWFDVLPKNSAGDVMHEQCVVVMRLPVTSCP